MSERDVAREVLLAATNERATLFRTNAGVAWQGEPEWRRSSGERVLLLRHPRPIHLLPTGFSDYAGWLLGGRFLAVETKRLRGKLREKQVQFRDRVMDDGGLYVVARCGQDFINAVRGK